MIAVKEAVAKAVEFAEDMLRERNVMSPPYGSEILLEEVERAKDGPNDVWLITLSVPARTPLGPIGRREYKLFTVRGDTGEVVSMKIRELADTR